MKSIFTACVLAGALTGGAAFADPGAYLEITLSIAPDNRAAAAGVYVAFKEPFLTTISGAESKVLLVRDDDVQVLHGFATTEDATAYLSSTLFQDDVVVGLKPYLDGQPDVRVYTAH